MDEERRGGEEEEGRRGRLFHLSFRASIAHAVGLGFIKVFHWLGDRGGTKEKEKEKKKMEKCLDVACLSGRGY